MSKFYSNNYGRNREERRDLKYHCYFTELDMNSLNTGVYYQKKPNKTRVDNMAANWNNSIIKANPLIVSRRGNQNIVIDGQHRLFAARIKLKDDPNKMLPCMVFTNLTEQQECELFIELNTKRTVGFSETLKAKYGAKDEIIVTIVRIIESIGLIYDFSNSTARYRITAIKATQEIFCELGEESFKDFFLLIKNTWDGVSSSLQDFHIRGMYEFYKKYNKKFNPNNSYDEKIFIEKLSKHSPEDIKKSIGSVKGSKAMKRFVEEIIEHYNYNQKKNKISD